MFEACIYLFPIPRQPLVSSKDCSGVFYPSILYPFGPLVLPILSLHLSTETNLGVCHPLCTGALLLKPCSSTHCNTWAAWDTETPLTAQLIRRSNCLDLKSNHSFGLWKTLLPNSLTRTTRVHCKNSCDVLQLGNSNLLPVPVGSWVPYIFIPGTELECDQTGCEDTIFWIGAPYAARLCYSWPCSKFGLGQAPKAEVATSSVLSRGKWEQMCWQGWPKGKAALVTEQVPTEDLWEILPGNSTKAEAIRLQKFITDLLGRSCSGSCLIALL